VNLKIRLSNSEEIQAPVEEWLAALLVELPMEQRARIYERIRKKTIFYQTPGCHILKAEGMAGILR
jgi:hypothetical protein